MSVYSPSIDECAALGFDLGRGGGGRGGGGGAARAAHWSTGPVSSHPSWQNRRPLAVSWQGRDYGGRFAAGYDALWSYFAGLYVLPAWFEGIDVGPLGVVLYVIGDPDLSGIPRWMDGAPVLIERVSAGRPLLSPRSLEGLAEVSQLGAQFSVSTQQNARQAVTDGWQMVYPGDSPPLTSLQAVQAIGAHEGSYGLGWKSGTSPVSGNTWGMVGSNNWGAVQCSGGATDGVCPSGCGLYTDSRPTSSGQQYYDWCYKVYASPAAGAAGILTTLSHMPGVMAALPSGNLDEIAWQMRKAGYFQGFTTDKRTAAEQYATALNTQAAAIATALGEQQVAYRQGESAEEIAAGAGNGSGSPLPAGVVQPDGTIADGSGNQPASWGDIAFYGSIAAAIGGAAWWVLR